MLVARFLLFPEDDAYHTVKCSLVEDILPFDAVDAVDAVNPVVLPQDEMAFPTAPVAMLEN